MSYIVLKPQFKKKNCAPLTLYGVVVAFISAVTLIAALKCELADVKAGDRVLEENWSDCLQALAHYSDEVDSSAHVCRVLTVCREQICKTQGHSETPGTDSAYGQSGASAWTTSSTSKTSSELLPLPDWSTNDALGSIDGMIDGWTDMLPDIDWLRVCDMNLYPVSF